MAAAGGIGVGGALLGVDLVLQGVGDIVRDIRLTARQFDSLSGSAHNANDAIGQLRAQLTTGATGGEFGGLAAQFRSIGLAVEQVPEIASAFRERLFRDPIAIGAFGRSVLPSRLGGPQDETAQLRQAVQALREATAGEERLYLARRLGLEVMLPLADADERHFRAMEEEGKRRGAMVDEEIRLLRGNRETQLQRLEDLAAERDIIRERVALRFGNWFRDNITLRLEELRTRLLERGAEAFGLGPANAGASRGTTAMQAHTNALRENTAVLASLKNQLANAGPRGRAAIPAGLRGVTLEEALKTGKLQTGAFIP